jgi:AcrR family transcriptional regulator
MPRPPARNRLLDTAESLFAEHGFAAVSLRMINATAGLSAAALHYHFGSKSALIEALLMRRMPELMSRRSELLDHLAKRKDTPRARDVLEAFLLPLVELMHREPESGHRYIRFVARAYAEGIADLRFIITRFQGGVAQLDPLLQAALPELPIDLVRLRLGLALDTVLHGLSSSEFLASVLPAGNLVPPIDDFFGALLDFTAGGLEAENNLPYTKFEFPSRFADEDADGTASQGEE